MTKHTRLQPTRPARRGLTIMEVMISIGVVLVGLVGIAALIPVASEDASSALRTDAAVRYASSVWAQLKAQNIHLLGQLARRDLDPRNDDGYNPNNNTLKNTSVGLMSGPRVVPNTPPGTPPFENLGPSMHVPYLTWASGLGLPFNSNCGSFCLDPRLLSRSQGTEGAAPTNGRTAYQRSRFPYYNEFYDGLTPPHRELTTIGNGFPFPRMWRVAWPVAPAVPGGPVFEVPLIADSRGSSFDDLDFWDADDPLDPVGQAISVQSYSTRGDSSTGIFSLGAREAKNNYSWIATFVPNSLGANRYKFSVVVIENRSVVDAPTSQSQDVANMTNITSAKNNFEAERVAWVMGMTQLGSVIEVDIQASAWVSDKLRANQWVMLSGQYGVLAPQATPDPSVNLIPATHHWYRVVSVSEPELLNANDNDDFNDTWTRSVTLDGPAWPFAFPNATPQPFGTAFMTIVDGAIAVIEDEITVSF